MIKYYTNNIGVSSHNERFIKEVMIGEEYKFLFDYDTVVDLGANIGAFTFWIHPHVKRIVAVEPDPRGVECMEKTIKDNSIFNVEVVQKAIAHESVKRLFLKDQGESFEGGYLSDEGTMEVETITIGELFDFYNIDYADLVKVDLEGGEVELFQSQSFRDNAHRIGTIIGEYHQNKTVKEEIISAGFRYTEIPGNRYIARK